MTAKSNKSNRSKLSKFSNKPYSSKKRRNKSKKLLDMTS